MKAFVLGAGLGTRLRPLTNLLPKPLIPVWNKPLITYAFDHLIELGIDRFIVNTHHLPERFTEAFPRSNYAKTPIQFVSEQPQVLETGGGLANVADHLSDGSFIVYNGDVLTDLPLAAAKEAHLASGNLVTLVLRSSGPKPNVMFDPNNGRVHDLRGLLGAQTGRPCQFSGIYFAQPEFLSYVRPKKESIIPAWISLIEDKLIGGVIADQGSWWDLGSREAYLEAAATLRSLEFPSYSTHAPKPVQVHPKAQIHPSAIIDEYSVIGPGCSVGANVRISRSIVWKNLQIGAETVLDRCVAAGVTVGQGEPITGNHVGADL